MAAKINFNGQEYDSLDDMPPNIRQAYEKLLSVFADADKDGLPDVFEDLTLNAQTIAHSHTSIIVNGQPYKSVAEMPAEARRAYEQMMKGFEANQDGLPDVFETFQQASFQSNMPSVTARPPIPPKAATSNSFNAKLIIAGAIIIILLLIIGGLMALLFTGAVTNFR